MPKSILIFFLAFFETWKHLFPLNTHKHRFQIVLSQTKFELIESGALKIFLTFD